MTTKVTNKDNGESTLQSMKGRERERQEPTPVTRACGYVGMCGKRVNYLTQRLFYFLLHTQKRLMNGYATQELGLHFKPTSV
jgi:hypothetical protein